MFSQVDDQQTKHEPPAEAADDDLRGASMETEIQVSSPPSQHPSECADPYELRLAAVQRFCDEATVWAVEAERCLQFYNHAQDLDSIPGVTVERILRDCAATSTRLDRLMVMLTRSRQHQLHSLRASLEHQLEHVHEQEGQLQVQLGAVNRVLGEDPGTVALHQSLLDRHCINVLNTRVFDQYADRMQSRLAKLEELKTKYEADEQDDSDSDEEEEKEKSHEDSIGQLKRDETMGTRREREN